MGYMMDKYETFVAKSMVSGIAKQYILDYSTFENSKKAIELIENYINDINSYDLDYIPSLDIFDLSDDFDYTICIRLESNYFNLFDEGFDLFNNLLKNLHELTDVISIAPSDRGTIAIDLYVTPIKQLCEMKENA